MDARGLKSCFKDEFGASPRIFRAPGRVNVIGEHTDYNDGFVLPSAIGFYTYAAIAPRNDRKLIIRSTGFSDGFTSNIGELPASRLGSWSDYPLGVIKMLQAAGVQLDGATLLLHGEVPIGSGLSSSAAVEVATALAVLSLSDRAMSLVEVAKLCQKAENEFVGARVGIMDQFVSC